MQDEGSENLWMSLLLNKEKRVCVITAQLTLALSVLYEKRYGIGDIDIGKIIKTYRVNQI